MNKDKCFSRANRSGGLLEACLLSLLREKKSYGYNLLSQLEGFGFQEGSIDISLIYRRLRSMEKEGLILSSWAESESGPQKRLYEISDRGLEALDNWIIHLRDRRSQIDSIIKNYHEYEKKERV